MAWTSLPASQVTDWALITYFRQFWEALKERQTAIGDTPLIIIPATGCDCQYMGAIDGGPPETGAAIWPVSTTDKFSVQCLQWWIEDNCHDFVATIDSGLAPITDFTGDAAIEMWTWAKIKTRILGGNGWTRKYPDGLGGATTAYGLARTGDYFGHWLWNELANVFNELIWTKQEFGWTNYNDAVTQKYGDAAHVDWATCKTNVEAAYDASGAAGGTDPPYCWTEASPGYTASMPRCYAYGRVETPTCETITKNADWYVVGEPPPGGAAGDFDANHDTLANGLLSRWEQTAGHMDGPITSGNAFGNLDYPHWCAEPGGAQYKGYMMGAATVVWNFTGFVYR